MKADEMPARARHQNGRQAEMLPTLERAMKAVLVEKRQALLNIVCDVDTNTGGD